MRCVGDLLSPSIVHPGRLLRYTALCVVLGAITQSSEKARCSSLSSNSLRCALALFVLRAKMQSQQKSRQNWFAPKCSHKKNCSKMQSCSLCSSSSLSSSLCLLGFCMDSSTTPDIARKCLCRLVANFCKMALRRDFSEIRVRDDASFCQFAPKCSHKKNRAKIGAVTNSNF